MPATGTIIPLAFSKSIFTKEVAPKVPMLLNEAAKKTLSTDYTNVKDRDAGMCEVTSSLLLEAQKHLNTQEHYTGSSGYNAAALGVYDCMVYGWTLPYCWRGEAEELRDLYRTCVGPSKKHCEFAVGTGLMLDLVVKEGYLKVTGDDADELTLIDLAPDTLTKAQARIEEAAGSKCVTCKHRLCNVVTGIETVDGVEKPVTPEKHTSVVANLMFHCLSEIEDGDSIEKAVGTISKFVAPEGVFFGSSILGKDIMDDEGACGASKHATELLCKMGIFGNLKHDMDRIEKALKAHFDEVVLSKTGHLAVWKAYKPKSS